MRFIEQFVCYPRVCCSTMTPERDPPVNPRPLYLESIALNSRSLPVILDVEHATL